MSAERWLPIAGWEQLYEVSSEGRVRSVDRTVTRGAVATAIRGQVLSQRPNTTGRLVVTLCRDAQRKVRPVHALVARAFHGPCPLGQMCRHLNGVETDNRADNLRWGTASENAHDQVRHGVHVQARKTHCPQNHEYTPENTIVTKRNRRRCRTCNQEQCRAYKARTTRREVKP